VAPSSDEFFRAVIVVENSTANPRDVTELDAVDAIVKRSRLSIFSENEHSAPRFRHEGGERMVVSSWWRSDKMQSLVGR
jgi:hypothetical protein